MVMLSWNADALPADWTAYRSRWEYGHAFNAILMFGALGCLVVSALVETPPYRGVTEPAPAPASKAPAATGSPPPAGPR
jgi:hypothetical protein